MRGNSRETPSVNPDFRDILSAFSAEGVEYLVVGAYALAAHGHPRATGDIDLWINAQPNNADRRSVPLGDLNVPVISREFLIRNKRACGRPPDLADLAWLERTP
jgi:hypothetical protein